MRLNKLQKTAVTALEDIKARDITVLDVRKLTSLYDTLVIASAESARQVKALAGNVRDKLKEAGAAIIGVEGEDGGEWVLVDADSIVVHVMLPTVRAHYNLEELWTPPAPKRAPAPKVAGTPKGAPASKSASGPAAKTPAKAARTTAKTAAKAAAKTAPRAAGKTAAKIAVKTAAKSPAKPAAKSPAKPAAKAPAKRAVKRAVKTAT